MSRLAAPYWAASSTRFGEPIDGKGPIVTDERRLIEVKAPGVMQREGVKEPLQTGIKAIDAMIPIGRGQRELIIGDRQTGKTAVAIDTIINQKGMDVFASTSPSARSRAPSPLWLTSWKKPARWNTPSSSLRLGQRLGAAAIHRALRRNCAMGEYFRDNGQHALIVYDDLSKHAVAYRSMSLVAAPSAGPRGLSGRRFQPALAVCWSARRKCTAIWAAAR